MIYTIILASGRSTRFMNSLPDDKSNTIKSKLDCKINNISIIDRICKQFSDISDKCILVCNLDVSKFEYVSYSNLINKNINCDEYNNSYSLKEVLSCITISTSDTLIIVDGDTYIDNSSYHNLRKLINTMNNVNYLITVDKISSNKSDNEWSVKTDKDNKILQIIDNSLNNSDRVTSGISIFNNSRDIANLINYLNSLEDYSDYWDKFYFNLINHKDSQSTFISYNIGNIYEIDNYDDYLNLLEIYETNNSELQVIEDDELSKSVSLVNDNQDLSNLINDNTIDNMKAFLVIYSKNQLSRVIKLNNALNKIEDKLINSIDLVNDRDIKNILNITYAIQKSLDNTISLIKQVTSDDSYLQVIIDNSNIVNNNLNILNSTDYSNSIAKIHNKDSRDKVRNALDEILSQINKI